MKKQTLHINQISYLNPLFDALRHSGVELESIKNKNDLKYFDIQDVDSYVPVKILEEFLFNIYKSQGISNLDAQLVNQFQLHDMGEFGEFLTSLPDALSMVNESIKIEPLISSNCKSQVLIKGVDAFYHWKFINPFSEGRLISEEFCFFMVLNGLTMALGSNDFINSIHLPRYQHNVLKKNLPTGDYKLVLTDNHYAIEFPTGLLKHSYKKEAEQMDRPIMPNESFRSKITILFDGLEDGVMPHMEILAMQSDISVRSLNRHLACEGTSFRELRNIYLLNRALFYLEKTNHSINYISQILGYDHTSNFVRAFKNITTVSPRIYRSQLAYLG